MINLPAHEYLDRHNIPYERVEFSPEIEKGAASVAHALGYNERVKSHKVVLPEP